MSDNKDRLTFSEACRELQISEEELEKLVADGEIASVKEGDTLFFKSEVIEQYKKNRKTEPTIVLSDEEMDLLDGVEDLSLDDLEVGDEAAAVADTAATPEPTGTAPTSEADDDFDLEELDLEELSLDDDAASREPELEGTAGDLEGDMTLEDDVALEEPAAADTSSDTVLNLDGLLDEEDESESTTPVPGIELTDTSDDITMEGTVSDDDTILDTDVLDLSDDADFQLDATAEGTVGGTDASTLLRGGGARVMQMKRVKGHPVMTTILLVTGILLLIPLAVFVNVFYFDRNVAPPGSTDTTQWIGEYNVLKDAIESTADLVHGIFK